MSPDSVPLSMSSSDSPLPRRLGLLQATCLNIANMVGIGPFVTIPLFIAAMNGPQAMIAWVIAAILVICDGLVWSELGAALPGSGGTYHFFREIFGPYRWGGLIRFLFIWQFLISGTMEIASGYIGAMTYAEYLSPDFFLKLDASGVPGGRAWLPALAALLVTVALMRRIESIGWVGVILTAGTIITVLVVIVAGIKHFNLELLTLPPEAFKLNKGFAKGLSAAMLIAIYDYFGYYNICHLGDEVRDPGRTIPRAVMISVLVVAAIYLTMNISIIGVLPWQTAMASKNVGAQFMEAIYGRPAAVVLTWLILWTSLACVFAITLGYSRIPYAAARNGDFFSVFAELHPTQSYPWVSLAAVGGLTATFCFLSLEIVIQTAVTVRILLQFIGQIVALHVLRTTRPDVPLPFRMWLYPLPSLIALVGWLFVFCLQEYRPLLYAGGVFATGTIAYFVWQAWASRSGSPDQFRR